MVTAVCQCLQTFVLKSQHKYEFLNRNENFKCLFSFQNNLQCLKFTIQKYTVTSSPNLNKKKSIMSVSLLEVVLLWSNKTHLGQLWPIFQSPLYLQHITLYISLLFYILIIQHIGSCAHSELTHPVNKLHFCFYIYIVYTHVRLSLNLPVRSGGNKCFSLFICFDARSLFKGTRSNFQLPQVIQQFSVRAWRKSD